PALARRMFGTALHFCRTALAGGDEQTRGAAVERRAGRVMQRVARRHLRRLLRIGKNLLVGRLEAAAHRRQRRARAEELQHFAPRGRLRRPQLARRRRWRLQLLHAAPGPALSGERKLHRWQVVQETRVWTWYWSFSARPSAS